MLRIFENFVRVNRHSRKSDTDVIAKFDYYYYYVVVD